MSHAKVFHGGRIYTADPEGSWTEAVAVVGGRIVALGSHDDVRAAHPGAQLIDLGDRTMLPGFLIGELAAGEGALPGAVASATLARLYTQPSTPGRVETIEGRR